MCLLFHKPADVSFTDDILKGFWTRNKDGFGVMYCSDGYIHYDKKVGKTADDWIEFFRKYENVDGFFHLRMATHGAVDLVNCHPYIVSGFQGDEEHAPVLLMHNGVLSTGNDADKTKSDTWHYIRRFIEPVAKTNPTFLMSDEFRAMVESHIGSNNKFAILDGTGKHQIVNKRAGVDWNGAWFSNTYAWDYYTVTGRSRSHYTGYQGTMYDDWNSEFRGGGRRSAITTPNNTTPTTPSTPDAKVKEALPHDWRKHMVRIEMPSTREGGSPTTLWVRPDSPEGIAELKRLADLKASTPPAQDTKPTIESVTPSQIRDAVVQMSKVSKLTKRVERMISRFARKHGDSIYTELVRDLLLEMYRHERTTGENLIGTFSPSVLLKAFRTAGQELVWGVWFLFSETDALKYNDFRHYMMHPKELLADSDLMNELAGTELPDEKPSTPENTEPGESVMDSFMVDALLIGGYETDENTGIIVPDTSIVPATPEQTEAILGAPVGEAVIDNPTQEQINAVLGAN